MRRSLTPLLVGLLVVASAGTAVASTEGSPDLSVHLPDNRVGPGEQTTLDLVLLNGGTIEDGGPPNEEARVTTARDVTVEVSAGDAPLEIKTDTQPVGNVPEGRVGPVQFAISVDESAEPGRYEVPVTVSYRYTSQTVSRASTGTVLAPHECEEETIERTVTIVVEERARFETVDASTDAAVGESGTVSLTLENVGAAAAAEARVALESEDGVLTFDRSPTARVFVGDWAPGERRTVTVEGQFAARSGVRPVPVSATVMFRDDDGVSAVSDPVIFGITPREQSFALEDVTSTLAVGDKGTLQGVVRNTGESVVRNAVVALETESTNVVPVETEFAIGDLGPDETATFAFNAEVTDSADAGPRQLSVTVRYRDTNDEVRRSDSLDARVDVGPRSDRFAVEPVSATFAPGESGVLELRVTNDGDEPVTDVSAKLFADDPLASSDDEAFIDELGPGESTTILFGLATAGDAIERKVYPVSMDFQYEDADGDTRLSDSYDVPVRVVERQGSDGSTLPILGGVAIALLAVLGGVWYWRRR
jgi:hypothetical protein